MFGDVRHGTDMLAECFPGTVKPVTEYEPSVESPKVVNLATYRSETAYRWLVGFHKHKNINHLKIGTGSASGRSYSPLVAGPGAYETHCPLSLPIVAAGNGCASTLYQSDESDLSPDSRIIVSDACADGHRTGVSRNEGVG